MMQTVLRIALYMISQHMGIHLGYVRYKFLFLVELMDLVDSRTLYLPQHTCINPSCERCQSGHLLKKEEQRQAVLYTLDKGAIPVRSVHLYCDSELSQLIGSTSVQKQCLLVISECRTNYYHNFRVKAAVRIYYDGIPDIIQVGEHQFIEGKLIRLWIMMMLVSW